MDKFNSRTEDELIDEAENHIDTAMRLLESSKWNFAAADTYLDVQAVLSSARVDLRETRDAIDKQQVGEELPKIPQYHLLNAWQNRPNSE